MRPLQYQPLSKIPANASKNSSPVDARQLFNVSMQVVSSAGSLAGTFKLQASNYPCLDVFSSYAPPAAAWTDIASTTLTFAQASAASSQITAKIDLSYVAIRVVFTDTSSASNTATATSYIEALGM